MVALQKAIIFGAGIWSAIAILGALVPSLGILSQSDSKLLMVPISAAIIIFAAFVYLREIHAQYEAEGLEIGIIWLFESLALELIVFGAVFGYGADHFLSLDAFLSAAFKIVFPSASGIYLQHTIKD